MTTFTRTRFEFNLWEEFLTVTVRRQKLLILTLTLVLARPQTALDDVAARALRRAFRRLSNIGRV